MKITPETRLKLDRFEPRSYQKQIMDAIISGKKKVLAILPRRAGKDIVAFCCAIRQCASKTCTVYYVFPTYAMGRKIIWDAIDNDSHRILDWYCPDEICEQKNSSDMKIRFKNGSILKFVGSDNYDSLVGSNFQAVIFSEYALQDPNAYAYLRPIMVANGAWALFITTPRGKNHLYDLYNIALNNSEWYCLKMSVEETGHIPIQAILKEKEEGLISEDLIQQEYYCSFELGIEGAYYTKYIDKMRLKGQIGNVAWESAYKVHVAFDLGIRDSTCMIFFQICNNIVRIIDFYENTDQGLEHYAQVLQQKGYNYGRFIMPHDIMVRDFTGGGITRYEKATQLGIKPITPCPNIPLVDGIECVRSTFSKVWIDETNCKELIKALENYRKDIKKGDSRKPVYADHPLHNWASNACFVGDTKISMADCDLAIKDVKEGMRVKTPFGLRKVLKVHKRLTNSLVDVHVGKSHLICTPEHDIFTHRGLVKSDALRYTDIMEPIGCFRGWVWQKIYGYYLKTSDLRGFKKIILSQKMNDKSSLMGTILDGMTDIITRPAQHLTETQPCSVISGNIIKVQYLKDSIFTTSMAIQKTMRSKISNLLNQVNIYHDIQVPQVVGLNQKIAKRCLYLNKTKQEHGTKVQKVTNGTSSMQGHCLRYRERSILSNVHTVIKNTVENKSGKNTVPSPVNSRYETMYSKILKNAFVAYAKSYSLVVNTLLKRHAVKSVQSYQLAEPKEVYDLTVEGDHCYYANGYLVSNSDAMRYLCVGLSKIREGSSPEELEKRYRETVLGVNANMPPIFRNDLPEY